MDNYSKTCPRCGKNIDLYALVCPHCGEMFAVHYTDDRGLYIQNNVSYYFRRFNEMNSSGSSNSWNWCAFLFDYSWMVYRKMYKEAIIFAALFLGITTFCAIFGLAPVVATSLSLLLKIFAGFRGNSFYMAHVDNLVRQGSNIPPYEKQKFAQKSGGTSFLSVIIFALIMSAANGIVASIFF